LTVKKFTVGYVIPTLGRDLALLNRAVQSVLTQEYKSLLVIVGPSDNKALVEFCRKASLNHVYDERKGIAAAWNIGVSYLEAQGVEVFGGLGEDDEILQGSTASLIRAFDDPKTVAAVGHIWYVNENGESIFHNRSYPEFAPILHWILNVIPHPGSLSRVASWKSIGEFDASWKFVADYDYWLKVRKLGNIVRVDAPMSLFRWHSGGITGGLREEAIAEGSKLRKTYTPKSLIWLFYLINPVMVWLGEKRLKASMKKDFAVVINKPLV